MDGRLKADCGLLNLNAMKCNEYDPVLLDGNFLNSINLNDSFIEVNRHTRLPDSGCSSYNSFQSRLKHEGGDVFEDSDFSDLALKYINQILMEEDIEDKSCMFQESAALQAAEESFYNVLMVKEPVCDSTNATDPFNGCKRKDLGTDSVGIFGGKSSFYGDGVSCNVSDHSRVVSNAVMNFDPHARFYPSFSSLTSTSSVVDGYVDSPVSIMNFGDVFCDGQSTLQIQKGVDESSGFFPNVLLGEDQKLGKLKKTYEVGLIPDESRGRKNAYDKDLVEDLRSTKQSAIYNDPTVRSKLFDDALLYGGAKTHPSQLDFVSKEATNAPQKGQPKGANGVKGRGKKQGRKKDVVDLRTLLSLCAQSVSANDQRGATDLLKRIREHASPTGDGMQRLAHYFSAGLEARMAGLGTGIYKALLSKPTSAADVLKAYHLFLSRVPFMKLSYFLSNKTILQAAQNKKKLHIIDFGIMYGFQWPSLIQLLSTRPGGPPELRITGIDFPCPGFRPSQRVEETGCRLANYAETFGVPFKFKAIAQKWETIRMEDLELDYDEALVVNSIYRFKNLLDETVIVESPRNKVLDLIRKMNPDIFIQGTVNGSYSAPFFVTRFREALFFFSSLFDMLDTTVDRDTEERMLAEKTFWGREAMNVIACEGGERIERPETYKQWQVRNQRAGFRPQAFDPEILKMAKDKSRSGYHKDFMIDEDGHWMLQGWKGRIIYAISCWKPAY